MGREDISMIVRIDQLSISFGKKKVLDGISFGVNRGETVALMGPNGAGKTTILRCVLGLLWYRGEIHVDGLDARRDGVRARRKLGYVPQVPAFYSMTAREVLRFVAKLRGVSRGEADRALERLGLASDAERVVSVFSGGMQQRLSLAASLLGDPPIILLDEPTANLDPAARTDLLGLLSEFRAAGKTLVMSSHRPREVRGLVDRVIVVREGRVASEGRPSDVLPADRVALSVEAHGSEEKKRLDELLSIHRIQALPSLNGTFEATIPAEEIVPIVERLKQAGVAQGRIGLRPLEDGGLQ
jgi:ABC-type multidrug transport system ATPase subunit